MHEHIMVSSPQEDGGKKFELMGEPAKLGLEWGEGGGGGASPYEGLTENQLSGMTPLLSLKK